MQFEAHLTIANVHPTALHALAHAHSMKYLHIVLPQGLATSQPMLTWCFSAHTVADAEIAVEQRVQRLRLDAGDLVRFKLESELCGPDVERTAFAESVVYLEQHVKVRVDSGSQGSLTEIAVQHRAHLSRNARSESGAEVRFLTQRFATEERDVASASLSRLLTTLGTAHIAILRTEREKVHIDTRLALDNGWAT
jgi:hypothetical protein